MFKSIKTFHYLCLFLIFVSVSVSVNAQTSLNVVGQSIYQDEGSITYSFGQIFSDYDVSSNYSIAEGVQQTYLITTVIGIEDHDYISLNVNAYPNPTYGDLNLSIQPFSLKKYTYQLTDMNSKLLKEQLVKDELTIISTRSLAPAIYFLRIISESTEVKVFKIIKN